MQAGQLIAGRYVIDALAGTGGMGRVYRARDERTGDAVALKVLNLDAKRYSRRFDREARLLAELDHPGIVRYVDTGVTAGGAPFIAMEWIDGEDLRQRMNRLPLTPDDALALARRVSRALGAAHARGVVHRDLKPSNLMLVDRDLTRVKLLDFGIARWRGPLVEKMTKTGISIGTPGYMAPEQARGDKDVGGAADVYAFGCVLFECLTGRRPFSGEDVAVLAKTVLAEPPRVSHSRDDISADFDDLLARMLSSDATLRPRDGDELAAALDGIERGSRAEDAQVAVPRLTRGERQLLCVVLIGDADEGAPVERVTEPSTPSYRGPRGGAGDDLARIAADCGGRLDRLADGSAVVAFTGSGAATDLVAQAARCALALRRVRPHAPIAVATGRGELAGRRAIGEAIDRAAKMCRGIEAAPFQTPPIRVDEVTAGLVGPRFDLREDERGIALGDERAEPRPRRLLGRPIRCVGRERELAYLSRMFASCVAEDRPRSALLVAPAGIGKSQVVAELCARLRAQHPQLAVWTGRGDPVARGAAFDILAQIVRSAAGLGGHEPLPLRRERLRARVAQAIPGGAGLRVAEFLGEMSGTPFSAPPDRVELRAARQNAALMGDQIRRAWEELVAAEAARQPTLIVLEDLHWGDAPTVRLIDGALRNVTRGAWMLLAVARPEIDEVFPELWSERAVEIVRLSPLSAEASLELVQEALGDTIDGESAARVARLAGGNAFYLEELIRAVAAGRTDEVPGTILAMAQARLGELPAEARQLLRAASVFGRVFWRGGVAALLGVEAASIDPLLALVVEQEFAFSAATTTFSGEPELSFRHGLLREAAYSTLTDTDRVLGHRLAGDWLERAGSRDALALATHFELGGEPARATEWYLRSAEQALEGNDLGAAIRRARRGMDCGASGEMLGALLAAEARALLWRGELADAAERGRDALRNLVPGSARWFSAAGDVVTAAGHIGQDVAIVALANQMLEAIDILPAQGPGVHAMARAAAQLFRLGRYDEGALLVARLPDDLDELAAGDPASVGAVLAACASRAFCDGDAAAFLELCEESAHYFDLAGDRRSASRTRVDLGTAYAQLGDHGSAETVLRGVLAVVEPMELSAIVALAKSALGAVLAHTERLEEAWDLELVAIETFSLQGDERLANRARVQLARIHQRKGHLEAAEREARDAVARSAGAPAVRMQALGQLAAALLALGRAREALDAAEQAAELCDALGQVDDGESQVRLVLAEAYAACDRNHDARAAIARAQARLSERAAAIADPRWRASFLENVELHRRTQAMARRWGQSD